MMHGQENIKLIRRLVATVRRRMSSCILQANPKDVTNIFLTNIATNNTSLHSVIFQITGQFISTTLTALHLT